MPIATATLEATEDVFDLDVREIDGAAPDGGAMISPTSDCTRCGCTLFTCPETGCH
ncbi:hypothetical protein ACFU99_29665 [Streptomyces sp. NPDC057654]|uniref:hypothetical protein n=1 Tax=Streptomyces sp. NPDC057654 TaxID=3346196 RepID=UPI0036B5D3DD